MRPNQHLIPVPVFPSINPNLQLIQEQAFPAILQSLQLVQRQVLQAKQPNQQPIPAPAPQPKRTKPAPTKTTAKADQGNKNDQTSDAFSTHDEAWGSDSETIVENAFGEHQ